MIEVFVINPTATIIMILFLNKPRFSGGESLEAHTEYDIEVDWASKSPIGLTFVPSIDHKMCNDVRSSESLLTFFDRRLLCTTKVYPFGDGDDGRVCAPLRRRAACFEVHIKFH